MAESRPLRNIDWVSAAMALATSLVLAWTVWLRFGPPPAPEPPAIGKVSPPLRLLDPETREPLVLLGLKGRVVWVSFWSASAPADLIELEKVWGRLKGRRKFSMVAAAVEDGATGRVRQARSDAKASLPVYLATPETRRAFGASGTNLPLHVLIDENGRIGAMAQGSGHETLARLVSQAERWLEELEPLGNTRFALRRRSTPREVLGVRSNSKVGPTLLSGKLL